MPDLFKLPSQPTSFEPVASGSTTLKSPAAKKVTTINNFNSNWQNRVQLFKTVKGIDLKKHVQPVFEDDRKRVQQGKKPYSNAQIVAFVHALQTGQDPFKKSGGHGGLFGFIGNAADDVGQIAQGLNPTNLVPELYKGGMGALAATGRLIGDVGGLAGKKGGGNTDFTNAWNDVLGHLPGYTPIAKETDKFFQSQTQKEEQGANPVKLAGEGLTNIRGVNLIPGSFTLGNLMQGKADTLAQHPIMTGLDVLPMAGKLGEGLVAAKYGGEAVDAAKAGEAGIIPKGSAWEALAEGKPLKAATRAANITGEGSKIEDLARQAGVSKDIRDVTRVQTSSNRELGIGDQFVAKRKEFVDQLQNAVAHQRQIEEEMANTEHPTMTQFNRLQEAKNATQEISKNINRIGNTEMIHYIYNTVAEDYSQLRAKLEAGGMENAHEFIQDNYVDLFKWSGKWSVNNEMKALITDGNPDALRGQMVPKYMADPLERLIKSDKNTILGRGWRGTTNLFKYAVLIGPRHTMHVLFSNAMFMSLDSLKSLTSLPRIQEALSMMHDPEAWPKGLQRGLGIGLGEDFVDRNGRLNPEALKRLGIQPENVHELMQGKTLGRMMKEVPGKVATPFRHMEEFITNFSRAMEYLYGRDKAGFQKDPNILAAEEQLSKARSELAPGQTNSMNVGRAAKNLERTKQAAMDSGYHEAGLKQAISVLMDIDGMSPIERQIIRQVMPFYPFTRQLLRYMAKFPAEHPMKAAVLAAIGRMEMQDAQSGLPMKMMSLFPITGEDNNGNALFIDTKTMNPFRSMNGLAPWTMAGFLSELNPMITAPFEARGFNILTASPELYPQLTIDPVTGDLVTKPQQPAAQTIAEQIVPQFQSIEGMMGWSKQLSQLKANDPEAYGRLLWSNLNMPFTTGSRNIAGEKIRLARNQMTVATQDATNAVKNNDFGSLSNYNYVPYQGRLYSPDQLKKALANG